MRSANVSLLAVKEQIQSNPSSNQLIETLDDLMFEFLSRVVLSTDYIEYTLCELSVHIFTNARRKFSAIAPSELKDFIFSFIVCNNKTEKLKILRSMRLERTVYFEILKNFEKFAVNYINESEIVLNGGSDEQLKHIEREACSINKNFYSVCTGTLFWCKRIYSFRNMIVEKYIRYARVEAVKAASDTGLNISEDDLTRALIISIFTAINKYDPTQGTLTGYIKWWFLDAKTNQDTHEEGVAYTIPSPVRRKFLQAGHVNIAAPIDQNTEKILTDDPLLSLIGKEGDFGLIDKEQELGIIGNIASRADNHKIYTLLNGIRYSPTENDISILKSTLRSA